jgi:hypothetical protein
MAFLMLLRRMKRDDLTAHGFRSTFRDWAAERTNFPSEVAEMALAHMVTLGGTSACRSPVWRDRGVPPRHRRSRRSCAHVRHHSPPSIVLGHGVTPLMSMLSIRHCSLRFVERGLDKSGIMVILNCAAVLSRWRCAKTALQFSRFAVDLARGRSIAKGRNIDLRPKSFEVLRYLAENADRLSSG